MPIDNFKNSGNKIYKIGVKLCIGISILALCYFGYYKYQQSKLKFQPPEGFSIEVNAKDITVVADKWLEAYTEQYQRKYVPGNKRVLEYSIKNIEIKEHNVIQVDFSILPEKLTEEGAFHWNGILEEDKIASQWVLWFSEEETSDGTFIYTVDKLQTPAGYDLEKYNTSGEKERDEYKHEYETEIPYEKQQYTYKIEDRVCYVSYNEGDTWIEVPVPLETLVAVGDGRLYYNRLHEGSYLITPDKTAFVYGGTTENPLMITYSEGMGTTWNTKEINSNLISSRLKFISFPTAQIGYVIATGDRTMSQEMQTIYKTRNGGDTWEEMGFGPSTWLLQSAGFVDENIGFMSYPKIEGAKTNFYRTEDGGKTFEPIILPVNEQEWMGHTFEPFIQPETPYVEGGQLYLLVGQGDQGDFKGGRVMAKYKSDDRGKTWSFVELVEPPSEEIG